MSNQIFTAAGHGPEPQGAERLSHDSQTLAGENGALKPPPTDGPFTFEQIVKDELAKIKRADDANAQDGCRRRDLPLAQDLPEEAKPDAGPGYIARLKKLLGEPQKPEEDAAERMIAAPREATPEPADSESAPSAATEPPQGERAPAEPQATAAQTAVGKSPSAGSRADFDKQLHDSELTALCLSGGGIRSATFCLGVLQALAKNELIAKFDYLSTVSGGGYIGGWLCAWASRGGSDMASVQERLAHFAARNDGKTTKGENAKKWGRKEPPEIENLRAFSNFLTPRKGLMSLDTWTGGAIVVRNLILNWLLFLPMFLLLVCFPQFVGWVVAFFQQKYLSGVEIHFHGVAQWFLIPAAILYFLSELLVGVEFTKILRLRLWQRQRKTTLADQPASDGGQTSHGEDRGLKGPVAEASIKDPPGRVSNASVLLAVLAAFVALTALSRVDLKSDWRPMFFLCMAGAVIWALPFALAPIFVARAFPPARDENQAPATGAARHPNESKGQSGSERFSMEWLKIVIARLFAGLAFGVALYISFYVLGLAVNIADSRYAVVFGLAGCLFAHAIGTIIFSALSSRNSVSDELLEWSARAVAIYFRYGIGWMILAGIVLLLPCKINIRVDNFDLNSVASALGAASGLAAALLGNSQATSSGLGPNGNGSRRKIWTAVGVAGAILALIALVLELSRLTNLALVQLSNLPALQGLADHLSSAIPKSPALALCSLGVWLVILGVWLRVASKYVNVNKFSLHCYYRNRLIRAFLGASNSCRAPNTFTDFDQADNLPMYKVGRVARTKDEKPRVTDVDKPLLIVNTALNQSKSANLAWQERKASSFTISLLTFGGREVGYRKVGGGAQDVSLGTAMAISGAAVSPNMGYNSSPILTLLMTLFNARLGWWLGNPRGEEWDSSGPRRAFRTILAELLGRTTAEAAYVYLSDGGHFENLGVYEMLRRRCRTIVVVDAGADPKFEFADLGNLIRKARIDLDADITFPDIRADRAGRDTLRLGLINRPKTLTEAPYCAIGDIEYRTFGGRGTLIYIKAAIHGDEPEDISSYAAAHPQFPHESTTDQFFSESQFESYRRLGYHIGSQIFDSPGESRSPSIDLEKRAEGHIRKAS